MTATVVRHPAKFPERITDSGTRVLRAFAKELGRPIKVLDPFAGVGRIHRCAGPLIHTTGVELEPEWAHQHPETIVAESLGWMRDRARRGGSGRFDAVFTSPVYGNRFSDHHEAKDPSSRRSYAHDLGRMPSEGSAAVMPWGPRYWRFHGDAYQAILSVLQPGGLFVLNVSDFQRHGELVHAVEWHHGAAYGAGFEQAKPVRWIQTQRMGHGANRSARAAAEAILILRRPA